MSKLMRWTMGVVCPLCFLAAAVLQAGDESSLKTYRDVDGQTYFAMTLRPTVPAPEQVERDIVLLVDTSASQTGLFRDDSLEAATVIVQGLNAGERLHMMAIDLHAVPLTDGFVKVGDAQLQQGLAKLQARTPLGATDLVQGLRTAIAALKDQPQDRARVVIYIGDGVSRANTMAVDELEPLTHQLTQANVSVCSYAIGLRRDVELLAVLANNSGGSVFLDGPSVTAQMAGTACLNMARGPVLWPESMKWPEAITEAYPHNIPPLRYDRASVVIGSMVGKDSVVVEVSAQSNRRPVSLQWTLAPNDTSDIDDYAMVPELVAAARPNDGLAQPLLGEEGLDEARRLFQLTSRNLSVLGKQAWDRGDVAGAHELILEALRRDPGNAEADALLKAITPTTTKGIAKPEPVIRLAQVPVELLPDTPIAVPDELVVEEPFRGGEVFGTIVSEPSVSGGPVYGGTVYGEQPLVLGSAPAEGDLLQRAQEERRLNEQIMRAEVTQGLADSRDVMRRDPESAISDLKNLRESVAQFPDLESGVRAELLERLELGLRQASRRRIEKERLDSVERSNLAALEARTRLLSADARRNEKVRQYVDQAQALLDEGRYHLAEEVALQARDLAPHSIPPDLMAREAHYVGNERRMREVFALKARKFADALFVTEEAHVPFPDDPPLVYPSADEWGPLTERRKARYGKADLAESGSAEQKIIAALDEDTRLDFTDTPLTQVIDFLEDYHDIQIELDTAALEEENIDATSDGITKNLSGISLRSGLKLMLTDLKLTYVIDNEVLMITSETKAEETLVTKVYPVGDLVIPIAAMSMGGGMMGGMMGGMGGGMMGGMGGGMGGGMMGGMGGGMGGMGGGMGGMGGGMMGGMGGMGGGMGGGMFDVEDSIRLGSDRNSTLEATSTDGEITPKQIDVTRNRGESTEAAWDRYFAGVWAQDATEEQVRQNFADIRETVRQLSARKDFPQIVAAIQSALRHGQYQPWMYQTLGLALRAGGASDDDIERAFMSEIDLTQDVDQIMMTAMQLSRMGLDERAMQLYRDVATAFPLRPEPYAQALEVARRLDDTAGIRWACQHILEQAWPEKHAHIFDKAVQMAKAIVYDLEKSGKSDEAAEFTRLVNDARARDVAIQLTWSGDADFDLIVREPSGMVCNHENQRTTSGGVMMGDAIANPDDKSNSSVTERYVCPKGFSGEYQVLVRRVWGEAAAGKVTLEIFTNVTMDDESTSARQQIKRQIDLSEKDALVIFGLEEGRLELPLQDHIVANIANEHIAMNRTALAQQFNLLADDDVSTENSISQLRLLARDPRNARRLDALLRGNGAVGFRPQLTTLPEGTTLSGMAIVSADRRYVRVGMSPFFSRIAEVQTFNFQTGDAAVQQGGGGGGGIGAGGAGGVGGAGGGFGGGGF